MKKMRNRNIKSKGRDVIMEKYMIGDGFGNMYNDESGDLFTNKGTIYNTKEIVDGKIKELQESGKYYNWQLNLWTLYQK